MMIPDIKAECPHCKEQVTLNINVQKIEIKEDEDPDRFVFGLIKALEDTQEKH